VFYKKFSIQVDTFSLLKQEVKYHCFAHYLPLQGRNLRTKRIMTRSVGERWQENLYFFSFSGSLTGCDKESQVTMGHTWHNGKIMNLYRFMTQSRQINLRSNHGFFDVSFLLNIFKSKKASFKWKHNYMLQPLKRRRI
jgi:hypothetical protein